MEKQQQLINLKEIREQLIVLEEHIIFGLVLRAKFPRNIPMYTQVNGESFFDFSLGIYVQSMQAYSPKDILSVSLTSLSNIVIDLYKNTILDKICKEGDKPTLYHFSAQRDLEVLQSICSRIEYGKKVVESKFLENPEKYLDLILKGDKAGIEEMITNREVEKTVLERVRVKANHHCQDLEKPGIYIVNPDLIVKMYEEFLIPTTKDTEIAYLTSDEFMLKITETLSNFNLGNHFCGVIPYKKTKYFNDIPFILCNNPSPFFVIGEISTCDHSYLIISKQKRNMENDQSRRKTMIVFYTDNFVRVLSFISQLQIISIYCDMGYTLLECWDDQRVENCILNLKDICSCVKIKGTYPSNNKS